MTYSVGYVFPDSEESELASRCLLHATRVYWRTKKDMLKALCLTRCDERFTSNTFSALGPADEMVGRRFCMVPVPEMQCHARPTKKDVDSYREAAGLAPLNDFGDYLTVLFHARLLARQSGVRLVDVDNGIEVGAGEMLFAQFTSVRTGRGWEQHLDLVPESELLQDDVCFFGRDLEP